MAKASGVGKAAGVVIAGGIALVLGLVFADARGAADISAANMANLPAVMERVEALGVADANTQMLIKEERDSAAAAREELRASLQRVITERIQPQITLVRDAERSDAAEMVVLRERVARLEAQVRSLADGSAG